MDLVTFTFCLIIVFLILSFLESRAERRKKSISVEYSFATIFYFKHNVSAVYAIILLTTATLVPCCKNREIGGGKILPNPVNYLLVEVA